MNGNKENRLDPRDLFVHAVLEEKARLGGSHVDEDLVGRILSRTVHSVHDIPEASPPRRTSLAWLVASASAAAALVAMGFLLSSIPAGTNYSADEFHFVVRYEPEDRRPTSPKPFLAGRPFDGTIEIAVRPISMPEGTDVTAEEWNIASRGEGDRELRYETFRVFADIAQGTESGRLYRGSVNLQRGDLTIEADELSLSESDSRSPIVASGVRLSQRSPFREAVADRVDYDPSARTFVLSGVSEFTTEDGVLRELDPLAQIVLASDSYTVRSNERILHH